jgi:hypothetical protein
MRDDIDIEETLRRFESDPGPEVKRSVLARFSQEFGSRRPVPHKAAFWKRPVPLYAAATGIIIAMGLSYVAGQQTAATQRPPETLRGPARALNAGEAPELKWEVAPNDLL